MVMVSDKKQAILKGVLKLVNRVGFYHISMKMVAQEAGVAAGTIYLYFKGKEELINELYTMIVTEFNNAVLDANDRSMPIRDRYEAMMSRAIQFYLNNKDYFSFIEQYTYAPFLFKENQEQNFTLLLPLYKMMREGKKQKLIKNLPDAILLSMVHGPMNTMLKMHFARKTDMTRPSVQQKFYDACWEAIAMQT